MQYLIKVVPKLLGDICSPNDRIVHQARKNTMTFSSCKIRVTSVSPTCIQIGFCIGVEEDSLDKL
jgi:hypothetical protein